MALTRVGLQHAHRGDSVAAALRYTLVGSVAQPVGRYALSHGVSPGTNELYTLATIQHSHCISITIAPLCLYPLGET
jgi:hypothetical protein